VTCLHLYRALSNNYICQFSITEIMRLCLFETIKIFINYLLVQAETMINSGAVRVGVISNGYADIHVACRFNNQYILELCLSRGQFKFDTLICQLICD
jgi:hypothetical protein